MKVAKNSSLPDAAADERGDLSAHLQEVVTQRHTEGRHFPRQPLLPAHQVNRLQAFLVRRQTALSALEAVEIHEGVTLPAPGGLVQLLEVVRVGGTGHAVPLGLQARTRLYLSVRLLRRIERECHIRTQTANIFMHLHRLSLPRKPDNFGKFSWRRWESGWGWYPATWPTPWTRWTRCRWARRCRRWGSRP